MGDTDRYYEILGLEPGASPEEVKQAYRDLAKVWHPDRFPNDPRLQQKAQEKLKEINEAYERLQSSRGGRRIPSDSRGRSQRTEPRQKAGDSRTGKSQASPKAETHGREERDGE